MRTLNCRLALLVVFAYTSLVGCAKPEKSILGIGSHELSLHSPAEWQQVEQEDAYTFKSGLSQILLHDTGPVTIEKFQREIERARDVFRGGELPQANDILNALRFRPYFPSLERWQTFADALNRARNLGTRREHPDPDAIEQAYTEMLVQIASLPNRDIESMAIEALARYEPLDRRSIAAQQALIVDGNSALLIETWDRLNHIGRARYVFILNNGNFLVVRTGLGDFSAMEPVFQSLLASIEFRRNNN